MFDTARNVARLNSRDRVVNLASYNQNLASLFYVVFVSSTGRTRLALSENWLSLIHIPFAVYTLTIAFGFHEVPSVQNIDTAHLATSPLQEVLYPIAPESEGAVSISDADAEGILDELVIGISRAYLDRVRIALGLALDQLGNAIAKLSVVTSVPLEDLQKTGDELPIVFTSTFPTRDGAKGLILSYQGKPCGKALYS